MSARDGPGNGRVILTPRPGSSAFVARIVAVAIRCGPISQLTGLTGARLMLLFDFFFLFFFGTRLKNDASTSAGEGFSTVNGALS